MTDRTLRISARMADGYTAVRISKPGFWLVKGPGLATAFAKGHQGERA